MVSDDMIASGLDDARAEAVTLAHYWYEQHNAAINAATQLWDALAEKQTELDSESYLYGIWRRVANDLGEQLKATRDGADVLRARVAELEAQISAANAEADPLAALEK